MIPFLELLLAFSLTLGVVFTYFTVVQRDLIKAAVLSAGQSIAFAFAYYLLAAIDILFAYIPVAVGIYTVLLLYLISKTERFEEVG
ncbi:MAG: hydrogenase subunit MbhD domain-containing protein [Candidatus Nezhaarchaeales archaeon]